MVEPSTEVPTAPDAGGALARSSLGDTKLEEYNNVASRA
jgi:hypothetical protein